MNQFKTALLMTALTLLLVFIGGLIGGRGGVVIFFVIALIMNLVSYWYSDKIVLKMYRAKEVSKEEAPQLHRIVERLASRANLPKPRIYIIENSAANAFATGRNPQNAAVAVTTGILNLMDSSELEGVLAHELSHIKNRDILIGTIAATLAGAIMMIANMARWAAIFGGIGGRDDDNRGGALGLIIVAIVAPIAALLIQMGISRSREYLADSSGGRLSGNPIKLANALRKLDAAARNIPLSTSPATAHMFIVNPLSGGGIATLFSTHPPVEDRIRRLEEQTMGRI